MTNYNERLDEQLNYLMEYSYKYGRCEIPSSENPPLIIARQAKQALTSLIKELVAEAYCDGFQKASKGAFKSQQAAKREAVEEVLDRLEARGLKVDTRLFKREIVATPHSAIKAERNKLNNSVGDVK